MSRGEKAYGFMSDDSSLQATKHPMEPCAAGSELAC